MTDPDTPSTLGAEACSAVSSAFGEPLPGTATEAAGWLLIEHPGPWGRKAISESRLDADVAAAIVRRCDESGLRPQLIRRETAGPTRICLVVDTAAATIRRLQVGDARELLDADLDRDGDLMTDPVFCVCTNARRDACCAVHGRAAVKTLRTAGVGEVWETSHVGGHRFAANLLCFPHGFSFGRLRADSVADVARSYAVGRVDLAHLRGRTCLPPLAQAAEWFVRQEAGFYGVDDVSLESIDEDAVVMLAGGYRWRLRIDTTDAEPPRIESCGAEELVRPAAYALTAIDAAPAR